MVETTGAVVAARAAFDRSDWGEAFAAFVTADTTASLVLDDLERAAMAARWLGEWSTAIDFHQRAFAIASTSGDDTRTAALAMELCFDHAYSERIAVATGWMQRAQRLLEGVEPCAALGRLLELRGLIALELVHDLDAAAELYTDALAIGRQCGDADTVALSLVGCGLVCIRRGDLGAGIPLVDEAMTDAITGCLTPWTTARIYCVTISVCQAVGDLRRASEWTDQAIVCARQPGMGDFPGDCRMHRAEITRLKGDWAGAEAELRATLDDLALWDGHHVGQAWYELGEIALRRGDFAAADDSFARAAAHGKDPQPGLAMLRLAEGDNALASALVRAASDAVPAADPLSHALLLPAAVDVQLACGDSEGARDAATRLTDLAATYDTELLNARAATARCKVALAYGDVQAALAEGRAAYNLWRDAGAPYEAALTQCLVANAAERQNDSPVAAVELDAAISVFSSLGATRDLADAKARRARLGTVDAGQRVCRTFMFTDIVDSTRLVAAMGDERWSSVLRWHDRTIREVLVAHGGAEVKQRGGGDGFFAVFEQPSDALACAIALQRRFAEHRTQSGFAPDVRVGVHEAEALLAANDYSGLGVHEAARITDQAEAGVVLASDRTVASVPSVACGPAELVRLKGCSEPIAIRRVMWEDA